MKSNKVLKGALVATAAMLPLSQAAQAEVNISGWVNEGLTWYDDGVGSDIVQTSDNGTTLGTRMTFAGSSEVGAGLTAGFEIILEPSATGNLLGFGSSGIGDAGENQNGHAIGVLGNSLNIGGSWGKVTVGLQTMPTDNIAVLADPSLTLWASISPVFRGNGATIQGLGAGATKTTWGSFLQCLGTPGLGIGIDCNGVYRQGIRYDLPAFGPVSVAVGYANDDIYDIAVKYSGNIGRMTANVHGGYSINQGAAGAGGTEAETFQIQAGLMDSVTGIFGSIAYQTEEADGVAAGTVAGDDTDAYWIKAGIKKGFTSVGDTSIAIQYGSYNDQFGTAADGITGSEVERIGFEVNQYFGSSLILYGVYEQLDLDVDGAAAGLYGGAEELDTFTLGGTYFF